MGGRERERGKWERERERESEGGPSLSLYARSTMSLKQLDLRREKRGTKRREGQRGERDKEERGTKRREGQRGVPCH